MFADKLNVRMKLEATQGTICVKDNLKTMMETRKLTVDEWRRMVEVGMFGEDERLEFRYGEIIKMTPIGKEHTAAVKFLNKTLVLALEDKAEVSPQSALDLGEIEVYPDLVIHQPLGRVIPEASDVLWIVEVSKSSLAYDRTTKLSDYALAGIPEYWIADLSEERFEVYLEPQGASYAVKRLYPFEVAFAAQAFPGLERAWLADY